MQTILYSGPDLLTNTPATGLGADRALVYLPRDWRPGVGRRGVIITLGSGDGFALAYTSVIQGLTGALTDAGYAAVISEFGGTMWGNATQRGKIGAAYSLMTSPAIGCRAKAAHVGFSMGVQTALAYAGNNAANVSSVLGVCGLMDMGPVANDPTVTAAYPGGWTEAANGATTNPKTMATAGKYANMDVRVGYTTGDQVVPQAAIVDFATRVGRTAENFGPQAHTASNLSLPTVIATLLAQLAETN